MNIETIRKDFPILQRKIHGKTLIYFDNAATTQKPQVVIDALTNYYQESNSNVHRSPHQLGYEATELYENTRKITAEFINAGDPRQIIFTKNASEAINLVAYSWGLKNLRPDDEILLTLLEHHSNIVPWQIISQLTGAKLVYVNPSPDLNVDIDDFREKLNSRTRLVSVTGMSNAIGTVPPVAEMVHLAGLKGAVTLIDGAQMVAHMPVDVRALNCDFLVFSGHKIIGPTGVGVLYGKMEILNDMPPFLGGGEMINKVELEQSTFAETPHKFEAGTPPIAQVAALGTALNYMKSLGMDNVFNHSRELMQYAENKLAEMPDITTYGPRNRGGILSFTTPQAHPHDIATILDQDGIAIRAGHHCAQPILKYLQVESTARASFYIYNTKDEIDIFVESLKKVKDFFG